MTYEQIKLHFNENDIVESLSDGATKKYSGYLTMITNWCGESEAYDSLNPELVLYENGKLARIVSKEIDDTLAHIENVLNTCKRLGCSITELRRKDYMKELGYAK